MDKNKEEITEHIDAIKEDLLELSTKIHSNPELGFKEYKATRWIQEMLESHGFEVNRPIGGLDTAFKGTYDSKVKGPTIALIAEYDALPHIGHGCGHNIIASSAVGGAIGVSKVIDKVGGKICVIGTPAEEKGGGKITLLNRGVFDDISCVLMMHPGIKSLVGRGALASTVMTIEFKGKSAHSAGPEKGINALQALIFVFNEIDSLRGVVKDRTKINGIITHGGVAANIIPDYARGEFSVRAKNKEYLQEVIRKIESIVEAATLVTGATANIKTRAIYTERYSNKTMDAVFKENMKSLGEEMEYPLPDGILGSSDIGNVSMRVPTIHPYLKIAESSINGHSKEFAQAAISDRGREVVIKGAKGLALTAYDILANNELMKAIQQEFDTIKNLPQ